jgi:hypothetical protein
MHLHQNARLAFRRREAFATGAGNVWRRIARSAPATRGRPWFPAAADEDWRAEQYQRNPSAIGHLGTSELFHSRRTLLHAKRGGALHAESAEYIFLGT